MSFHNSIEVEIEIYGGAGGSCPNFTVTLKTWA